MKKLFGGILVMLLFMALVVSPASAATGSAGACGVTVWTDATNYSTSATTVDWKASKGSDCGTVYYKAEVEQIYNGNVYGTSYVQSGYFAGSTPIKSFSISTIKARTPYFTSGAEAFRIHVRLYSKSDYTGLLGGAKSATFYVY